MERKTELLSFLEGLKRLGMSLSLLLCSILTFAQTFEVDGIRFKIVDESGYGAYEAVVVKGGKYTGHVEIPEQVTYEGNSYWVRRIGEEAFENCSGLTTVTLPPYLFYIEQRAFSGCTGLTSIVIPERVMEIGNYAFYGSGIKSLTIGRKVKSIGSGSFSNCKNLTSVSLPGILTTVSSRLFLDCTSLTSVSFGGVKTIEQEAFRGCTSLESITIPKNVLKIGGRAFSDCTSLKTLILQPDLWYGLEFEGGNNTFNGSPIETIIYDRTVGSKSGISPFEDMTTLKNVVIRSSIVEGLFRGCTNLSSVNIDGKGGAIGRYAFYNCKGLQTLELPKELINIEEYAFAGCTGLTSLSVGDDIHGMRYLTIFSHAFDHCTGLKTLYINSISGIQQYAFLGCTSLEDIHTYNETPPSIYATSFDEKTVQNATLHVPEPSLTTESQYKEAFYWKDFFHIVIDLPSSINVIDNKTENSGCIYNLQGRKVTTPQKNGLYIKNGKKFIFR
ncbi:MAG: leucine-rich repeat domain-containing protein [Prevotella sp.]|nr:leucine-rich repeat domain-containing protein [Prevotella sp.]